jgi:hypothetical protein
MFNWLFANRRKSTPAAMRANIADKLRGYNADEDTTISEFTLADDEKGKKTTNKMLVTRNRDVWCQANPSETGKWNKEGRR